MVVCSGITPSNKSSSRKRRRTGRLKKFAGIFADIALAEDRIPCDEQFRPGSHYVPDCIKCNPAVDFDAERQAARFADMCKLFDFLQRVVNEMLSAKPGIYGHHQYVMHQVQNFV